MFLSKGTCDGSINRTKNINRTKITQKKIILEMILTLKMIFQVKIRYLFHLIPNISQEDNLLIRKEQTEMKLLVLEIEAKKLHVLGILIII